MEAIAPINLFPFVVSSAVIRNTYFIDSNFGNSGNFCCDFRFKAKTVLLQQQRLEHISAKQLVSRFHIRKIHVGKHIGEGCE